jgi:hypothetical protein
MRKIEKMRNPKKQESKNPKKQESKNRRIEESKFCGRVGIIWAGRVVKIEHVIGGGFFLGLAVTG